MKNLNKLFVAIFCSATKVFMNAIVIAVACAVSGMA